MMVAVHAVRNPQEFFDEYASTSNVWRGFTSTAAAVSGYGTGVAGFAVFAAG
jgi:hypothetical protein